MQKGDFTVEIVNAETKEPFREHTGPAPSYETYVEVEPDLEYYIKVTGLKTRKAYALVEVDKVSVGYYKTISSQNGPQFVGCINSSGDTVAFLFAKTHVFTGNQNDAEKRSWTGTVKATFYEHLGHTNIQTSGILPSWKKGNVGATLGVTALNQKKGVCSEQGSTVLQSGNVWGPPGKTGAVLGVIEMKYCSTVGLINFGLLPKPCLALLSAGDDSECQIRKKAKREKVTIDLTKEN